MGWWSTSPWERLYAGAKRMVEKDLGCIGEAGAPFSNYGGRVAVRSGGNHDLSH